MGPGWRPAPDLSFAHRGTSSDDDRVVLDMSNLRWLHPAHLVAAAASADLRARRGELLEVRGPRRQDQLLYASRMRLGQALDELDVRHDFPRVRERDRRRDLLEVRRVETEDDACRLAELVQGKVRPQDDAGSRALFACVVEMALNVANHASAAGYVAAQTMPARGEIRFAVADAGLGLLGTLAVRGARTHADAMDLALRGVSRFGDDLSRGTGMPSTLRTLTRGGGSLYLASGDASSATSATDTRRARLSASVPGTVVQGTLRVARPAEAS